MPTIPRRVALVTLVSWVGLLLVATLPAGAQPAVDGQGTRTPRTPGATPSPTPGCLVTATHHADPMVLGVGHETVATVHVGSRCSVEVFPLHIELVLDASSGVDLREAKALFESVEQIIRDLQLSATGHVFVGLVGFNDSVRSTCPLGNDEARALSCLRRIANLHRRQSGPVDQSLDRAITEGLIQLRRARKGRELREVMIVFSQMPTSSDCAASIRSAGQVKGEKVLVMSVCVGAHCDVSCMRRLASSPRYFYLVEDSSAIVKSFQRIHESILRISLKRLDFFYLPSETMRYVPDSADPAPNATPASDGRLSWRVNYVPRDGVTFTLRLAPTGPGRQPLASEAGGEWVDIQNRVGKMTVPTVEVDVTP